MKIEQPLAYLAGPYSHPQEAIRHFRGAEHSRVAAALTVLGHHIYAPIPETIMLALHGNLTNTSWEFWRGKDLNQLSRCDEMWIITLKGWKESVGVRGEVKFCLNNNIRIALCDPKTLELTYKLPIEILKELNVLEAGELND